MKQKQFLDVVSDEEAHRLLTESFTHLAPRMEICPLEEAWQRILAEDVRAAVDVPGFDRSNMDGFAVRAEDTFGAEEHSPRRLRVLESEAVTAGASRCHGEFELLSGCAVPMATGGVLPRGADAVIMVEDTAPASEEGFVEVYRALSPGSNIAGAGSDVGRGEVVLFRNTLLGSREAALLAATGVAEVKVWRQPRVAVLSTGDEVKAPGSILKVGEVYDSNSRIICDAVRELGGRPHFLGICPDHREELADTMAAALQDEDIDLVLLSGGTSKGRGDLNFQVVQELAEAWDDRGIIFHGVALKPGKPVCAAILNGKPLVILPGFPTSAIFTFHEFVAPLLGSLGGHRTQSARWLEATMPLPFRSHPGRTEYVLVDLVPGEGGLSAYPLGAGSGSVSTFSRADGFIRVPRHQERLEAGEAVSVRLISSQQEVADLTALGSHCIGLDYLLSRLNEKGFRTKSVLVGSLAGLQAQARGEADVCGSHLLDEKTGIYNASFMDPRCVVLGGYGRRQGIVFRRDDDRFRELSLDDLKPLLRGETVRMVNRNRGSGTRVLLDRLLNGARPPGFFSESRSHHGVAAAVAQGRADWGITLDTLAGEQGLGFVFVQMETFELIIRGDRPRRPALQALADLLQEEETKAALRDLGLVVG